MVTCPVSLSWQSSLESVASVVYHLRAHGSESSLSGSVLPRTKLTLILGSTFPAYYLSAGWNALARMTAVLSQPSVRGFGDPECPVCFEALNNQDAAHTLRSLPCRHSFCTRCAGGAPLGQVLSAKNNHLSFSPCLRPESLLQGDYAASLGCLCALCVDSGIHLW